MQEKQSHIYMDWYRPPSLRLLRDTLTVIRENSSDAEFDALRPSTRYGGRRGNHDHRTAEGLYLTIKEYAGQPQEWVWNHEYHNRYAKRLHASGVADRWYRDHLKPRMSGVLLSSQDIHDVIRQRTRCVGSDLFQFLGCAQPTPEGTRNVVSQARPNVLCYGLIWNTQPTTGAHWVAVLIWPSRKTVEYFDPQGSPPTSTVQACWLSALHALHLKPEELTGTYSDVKHQQSSTECGMYVIWYIIWRVVQGLPVSEVRVPDSEMQRLRQVYFSQYRC